MDVDVILVVVVVVAVVVVVYGKTWTSTKSDNVRDPSSPEPKPCDARAVMDDFLLLIVSSPSGAGKTTLCKRLRGEFPDLRFSVSHTTRKPRPEEVDGREYHFVDVPTFEQMVRAGAFAEWARVHDNLYGTSLKEIEIARSTAHGVLFDIDYQGARQIKASLPDAIGVFILPPSLAELERRLRGRGTEDDATAQRRLTAAKGEIAHYGLFDYVIVNDDIGRAYEQLRSVVFSERCRRARHASLCEKMLLEGTVGK